MPTVGGTYCHVLDTPWTLHRLPCSATPACSYRSDHTLFRVIQEELSPVLVIQEVPLPLSYLPPTLHTYMSTVHPHPTLVSGHCPPHVSHVCYCVYVVYCLSQFSPCPFMCSSRSVFYVTCFVFSPSFPQVPVLPSFLLPLGVVPVPFLPSLLLPQCCVTCLVTAHLSLVSLP